MRKITQKFIRFLPPRALLLCPGPVQLSGKVKREAMKISLSHRDQPFSEMMNGIDAGVRRLVKAKADFTTLLITGSGTIANESVIASFGSAGRVLILTNGEFGERLALLAATHKLPHKQLNFGWNKLFDLKRVAAELKQANYGVIICVHHETSTGMLNPIKDIAKLARKRSAIFMVDAVSSLGAEVLDVGWGIDVITSSSGKALAAMPGVGLVIIHRRTLAQLPEQPTTHYLNLHNYHRYKQDHNQTPNTPAIHIFASLQAALEEQNNADKVPKLVAKRAAYCRQKLSEYGIKYSDYGPNSSSCVVTNVVLPVGMTSDDITVPLKANHGIVLYDGKGPLKGSVVQIGHIGHFSDVRYAVALRNICQEYRRHHKEV